MPVTQVEKSAVDCIIPLLQEDRQTIARFSQADRRAIAAACNVFDDCNTIYPNEKLLDLTAKQIEKVLNEPPTPTEKRHWLLQIVMRVWNSVLDFFDFRISAGRLKQKIEAAAAAIENRHFTITGNSTPREAQVVFIGEGGTSEEPDDVWKTVVHHYGNSKGKNVLLYEGRYAHTFSSRRETECWDVNAHFQKQVLLLMEQKKMVCEGEAYGQEAEVIKRLPLEEKKLKMQEYEKKTALYLNKCKELEQEMVDIQKLRTQDMKDAVVRAIESGYDKIFVVAEDSHLLSINSQSVPYTCAMMIPNDK